MFVHRRLVVRREVGIKSAVMAAVLMGVERVALIPVAVVVVQVQLQETVLILVGLLGLVVAHREMVPILVKQDQATMVEMAAILVKQDRAMMAGRIGCLILATDCRKFVHGHRWRLMPTEMTSAASSASALWA